jgi:hypothetical protein
MPITAFYAALLAALFVYLSVRVIGQRGRAKVEIGPGQDPELFRRMRVHANFAEYVPMALVLMALAESVKAPSVLLHGLGALLLAGRLFHAYGLSRSPQILKLRVFGMTLTFIVVVAAALTCFVLGGVVMLV